MNSSQFCFCTYCQKDIGKFAISTFVDSYKGYDNKGKKRLFCNETCYKKYIKQFEVEEYNGRPLYSIKCNNEVRYMPYWFSGYYFTDIESCKTRMDAKIAIPLL